VELGAGNVGLGERRDICLLESRKALGFDASKSI